MKTITLTPDRLKALARYETDFAKLAKEAGTDLAGLLYMGMPMDWLAEPKEPGEDTAEVIIPEMYQYTLEDMQKAVKAIIAENPAAEDFGKKWRCPMTMIGTALGLGKACARDDYGEDVPPEEYPFDAIGLPLLDTDIFKEAWDCLENLWLTARHGAKVCDNYQLAELDRTIDTHFANKGKAIVDMEFDDFYKEQFLSTFESKRRRLSCTETEKTLMDRWLSELCAKGNMTALQLRFTIEEQNAAGDADCDPAGCKSCHGCK